MFIPERAEPHPSRDSYWHSIRLGHAGVRESGNDSYGFRAMARTLLDKGPRSRLERIEQQLACRGSDPLRRPLFLYNQDSLAALSDLLGRCYKT